MKDDDTARRSALSITSDWFDFESGGKQWRPSQVRKEVKEPGSERESFPGGKAAS